MDPQTGALLARNPWNERVRRPRRIRGSRRPAVRVDRGPRRSSSDATATLDAPAALARDGSLSGASGAGLDPCAALQTTLRLAPGSSEVVLFLLGQGDDESRRAATRRRATVTEDLEACLASVRQDGTTRWRPCRSGRPTARWTSSLNRWLLYQTLSCRVLGAASAFYQAGGAYGFRDQLQDVMALTARAARRRARASAARRVPPVRGGRRAALVALRRRARACARASPTTCSGCRTPSTTTSRSPATRACSTRRVPYLRRPSRSSPRSVERYFHAQVSAESGDALRALRRARSTEASPSARTACR